MGATESLIHRASEFDFERIEQLLECIPCSAVLISRGREPLVLNQSAKRLLKNQAQQDWLNAVLPNPAIWNRAWQRIKKGHTVTSNAYLNTETIFNSDSVIRKLRIDLSLSLWSADKESYVLCVIYAESSASNALNLNLSKFPDENPNPVLRVSRTGQLLYANRASEPLLKCWFKHLSGNPEDEAFIAFNEAACESRLKRSDIVCGDRVFSVAFAPVAGSDYLNIYALDTTDKKSAEQALKLALVEVGNLKTRLQQENHYLQDEIKQVHDVDEMIGNSDVQAELMSKIRQVASTDATVLILGETGTGKELIARAIHKSSKRSDRPLVKVNCAALPTGLIESELFGHEKGSFTGAIARKVGRFEVADGGTIFLDEIGDLPLELQSKLLRVLQEGELQRVGGNRTIRVNARVIAATNRNLPKSMAEGEFREDLFYRLNVFPIQSPPLRERKDDIVLLAYHFLNKYSVKIGKAITAIDDAVKARLQAYSWPGNVRELENAIERAIILSEGSSLQLDGSFDHSTLSRSTDSLKTLKQVEQEMIQTALQETDWRIEGRRGAATRLGMAPSTLRERIRKYGIARSMPTDTISCYSS